MSNRQLNEAERKWNLMWDLWVKGESESPYTELMSYESEINNGGHSQYFFNTADCGNLKRDVDILLSVLPESLNENLKKAYDAFSSMEDIADDSCDELLDECDQIFYENESQLMELLQKYADSLSL